MAFYETELARQQGAAKQAEKRLTEVNNALGKLGDVKASAALGKVG
jgi:hypothetical protein